MATPSRGASAPGSRSAAASTLSSRSAAESTPGSRSAAAASADHPSSGFSSSAVLTASCAADGGASPAHPRAGAGASVLQFHDVTWGPPGGHALWARPLTVAVGRGVTGIVGANGSGKSVFLQLAVRALQPASGVVLGQPSVHAVAQEVAAAPQSMVADIAGLGPVLGALERLAAGEGAADDVLAADRRWDLPARWQQALQALGLAHLQPGHAARQLSGGERMRVALAGAFLSGADLLVLDEPTNHLDRPGRRWLLESLGQWTGSVLVASHDRELLGTVGSIVALSPAGLQRYGGNWALYQAQRQAEAAAAQADLDHARTERERALRTLQRDHDAQLRRAARGREVGRTANQASVLLDRQKNNAQAHAGREHERQQQEWMRLNDAVREAASRLPAQAPATLVLPQSAVPAGKQVLAFEQVVVPHAAPGQPPLDGVWSGPVRIAVMGPNGCGKSSLLRLVAAPGEVAGDTSGDVSGNVNGGRVLRSVRAAWLDQHNTDMLPPGRSVLAQLQALGSPLPEAALRTHLAQMGLGADKVRQPSGQLSGGERIKAALACAL
ncbi:MAG: ABC-F family ATP-binding cassette domain-containing protein, partial [Acidovorax sp.]